MGNRDIINQDGHLNDNNKNKLPANDAQSNNPQEGSAGLKNLRSEMLFKLVWEHSPEGFRLADENGRIVMVNEAFCRMIGKKRAEIEGSYISSIYAEDLGKRVQEQFIKRFKNRDFPARIDDEYILWDGRRVWFEVFNSFFEFSDEVPLLLSIFRDVTERRTAYESLRQSEYRYRSLAENISDIVCEITLALEINDVSPSVKKFLDWEETELKGKHIGVILTEPSLLRFKNVLGKMLEKKRDFPAHIVPPVTIELDLLRKDSVEISAEARINLVKDEDGKTAAAIITMRDISERRRAQAILRLQSAALESVANGIVITNYDGLVVWTNPAFTRLTGYELEEVVGKKLNILKSGKHERSFYANMWNTVRNGRVWRGEIINRRKDGSLYHEEMIITPVWNQNGEITHFVAVKQDVTARKEMEEELRCSNQRFQLIFNSTPAAIAITSTDDLRFIEVNESFLKISGYSRNELIGACISELGLLNENDDEYKKMLQILNATGSADNFELKLHSKKGDQRLVMASGERIFLGVDNCIIFIFNDITERKRLEEELRHAQRLESIGTLAGGVAHDFNNILTIIQGHASLALLNPSLPSNLNEALRQIAEAAERGGALTRQLLTFSRKQKLEQKYLNLNNVIENITKMLRRIIGEHIKLECHYDANLPHIYADLGMMEQIIMNLAINARDAMPQGGRLSISTASANFRESDLPARPGLKAGTYIYLKIQDTGHGIAEKDLPKIFDPFFTTKEPGKGTGLGLATVQSIVSQHNGWIEVQSELGVGTTFTVYLPAAPTRLVAEEKLQSTHTIKGGSETILVVEDEVKICDLAKATLEQYGYSVFTAKDGIEALEVWQNIKDKVTLLITDIVLPRGLNGRMLAERLCAEKPDLRVIFTTGYSPEAVGDSFFGNRVWQFIQKPYLPSKLAETVRQTLDAKMNIVSK